MGTLRQGEPRALPRAFFPRCCIYLYSLFNERFGALWGPVLIQERRLRRVPVSTSMLRPPLDVRSSKVIPLERR